MTGRFQRPTRVLVTGGAGFLGSQITIRELAETILAATGSRSPIVSRPLPLDDPRQRQPDIAKARSLLGWAPKVGLEDGLRETVRYFQSLLAS